MAQLLVFQRDNYNVNDDSVSYKIGDVVMVAEDSHVFGSAELQYPFAVVQVAGSKADYDYLTESEPLTLRDKYPRSLFAIKRLRISMLKQSYFGMRARRKHSVDLSGNVNRKQLGAV